MKRGRDNLPAAVYTTAQVRAFDRIAIEERGIPGYELMCRAGRAALDVLAARWPDAHKVAVVCGAGNNAGDGYVVARLARAAGYSVRLEAVVPPERLRGDAKQAWEDCRAAGVAAVPFGRAREDGFVPDVVVDALLGTGLDRPVEGAFAAAIDALNAAGAPILALDVPSGLDADTGRVMNVAVRADVTVTFVGLKQGLFLGEAPDYRGELEFSDLMVPPDVYAGAPPALERLTPALLERALPRRARTAHKGTNGRVLLVGGGPGMPGAIRLAAEAALRVGAGLVYVATWRDSVVPVMAGRPELMCRAVETVDDLEPLLELADVVVVGPGLGRSEWARRLFRRVLASARPLVVDADGLNLLAEAPERRGNWVLTPHPGEASRLLGRSVGDVQADRLGAVRELVARFDATVVLKGACSLVGTTRVDRGTARVHGGTAAGVTATADGTAAEGTPTADGTAAADGAPADGAATARAHTGAADVAVCDYGNPGMGTGGTGDVLAGVLGGLAGQLGDLARAARAGVLLHALAGDDAAADGGERGMAASDLLPALRRRANPR
ncbi:MAG TPA: NAD(P)H-hydrate dehydratase [Gammaproteobacteria bacterium]